VISRHLGHASYAITADVTPMSALLPNMMRPMRCRWPSKNEALEEEPSAELLGDDMRFTDEEITYLSTISADHAKVAQWENDGRPGLRSRASRPPKEPPSPEEVARIVATLEAEAAAHLSMPVDHFRATLDDASTLIALRRLAFDPDGQVAKNYRGTGQEWFDEALRMREDGTADRYLNASPAERQRMQDEWTAANRRG
jgi:hypothetical protein